MRTGGFLGIYPSGSILLLRINLLPLWSRWMAVGRTWPARCTHAKRRNSQPCSCPGGHSAACNQLLFAGYYASTNSRSVANSKGSYQKCSALGLTHQDDGGNPCMGFHCCVAFWSFNCSRNCMQHPHRESSKFAGGSLVFMDPSVSRRANEHLFAGRPDSVRWLTAVWVAFLISNISDAASVHRLPVLTLSAVLAVTCAVAPLVSSTHLDTRGHKEKDRLRDWGLHMQSLRKHLLTWHDFLQGGIKLGANDGFKFDFFRAALECETAACLCAAVRFANDGESMSVQILALSHIKPIQRFIGLADICSLFKD